MYLRNFASVACAATTLAPVIAILFFLTLATTSSSVAARSDIRSFDEKVKVLRAAASVENARVTRKLIESLDETADIDLADLKMTSRSMMAKTGCTYGGYGPYGSYTPCNVSPPPYYGALPMYSTPTVYGPVY
ncbi:hypothetical protein CEUSTIGMA_g12085.t1 [Chlamydomonas eustigma]|uniref:Uncharacterized protein n=1 Tax=Chlamydomonas eustigma TaxID=1157962 RepID=A0A250XNJ5_9CHLO|nr:hypothetical protein CEUSTIGMA_g12085.t1 [Chlamydomonas eustigma]|eukprot:GAX84664.1 hypothetical protein CEUSTIGMA_g12085.t1 [Chlamydomonas eustigma]